MDDYPQLPSHGLDAKALHGSRGSPAIELLQQSTSRSSMISAPDEFEESDFFELSKIIRVRSNRAVNFLKDIEAVDSHNTLGECCPCNMLSVLDNDYSYRIMGSKNAIEKEELNRQKNSHFIIHPFSRARFYWDFIILTTLVLNSFLQPILIAFFYKVHVGWLIFNILSDLILIMDIMSIFWSGVVKDSSFIFLDLKEIRKTYAKSWLIADVISLLPFNYIALILYSIPLDPSSYVKAGVLTNLRPLLKILSMLKIIRMFKFLSILPKWKEKFHASWTLFNLIILGIRIILICHWNGCIQFLVVSLEGFPPDSWVAINNLQNEHVGTQYSYAVFKAVSHMLCIGFGQRPPKRVTDIWITLISMLTGLTLFTLFVGHMNTYVMISLLGTRRYTEKLGAMQEYMKYHKIPWKLRTKVRDYFYQKYRGKLFNEKEMLKQLSHILEEEIHMFHYQDMIKQVSLFKGADETFINSIISKFRFEVFLEGDFIIRYNATGNVMYFIEHGEVQIINNKGDHIKTLVDGDYFGEISLLLNKRRQGHIKATTVCFVYCLEKIDLNSILNKFPNLRASLELRARLRLEELYRSEDRSPDHFDSIFSDKHETETMSDLLDDAEIESTESLIYSKSADNINKQLGVSITLPALSIPQTT